MITLRVTLKTTQQCCHGDCRRPAQHSSYFTMKHSEGSVSSYVSDVCRNYYNMDSQRTTPARRFIVHKIILAGGCTILVIAIVFAVSLFKTNDELANKNSSYKHGEKIAQQASFGQGYLNIGTEKDKVNGVFISSSGNDSFEMKSKYGNVQSDGCKNWSDSNYKFEDNEKIYFQYWMKNDHKLRTISDDSEIMQRLIYQRRIESYRTNSMRPKTVLTLSLLDNDINDLRRCSQKNNEKEFCNFTTEKEEINGADAVIIRDQDLKSLPIVNRANQIWIYNTLTPKNYMASSDVSKSFNLTGTYEFTSHIPMLPLYWSESKPTKQREMIPKNYTDKVVKLVIYNKNCEDEEMFYRKYKRIIQKLEDKDSVIVEWFNYHNCSKNDYNITRKSECLSQSSAECYKTLGPLKKFALAFEIHDSDYISDRFFHPLNNFIIPIAIGSTLKKYSAVSPKKSFIFYCNSKVDDLIEKLKYLNSNKEELENYFNWRKEGVFLPMSMWYCQICFMLHRATREALNL